MERASECKRGPDLCHRVAPGVNLPRALPHLLSGFHAVVVPHVDDLVQLADLGEEGSDRLDELLASLETDAPV